MTRLIALVAVVVAVIVGVVLWLTSGGTDTHKATCWKPAYAANPTATWAKHPSATHRHGEGPRGVNVCDPK